MSGPGGQCDDLRANLGDQEGPGVQLESWALWGACSLPTPLVLTGQAAHESAQEKTDAKQTGRAWSRVGEGRYSDLNLPEQIRVSSVV